MSQRKKSTVPVPKSEWGPGDWQNEPDRVDFVHAGLACLLLRHFNHGYWCGYVGIPPEHPLYGKLWTETPEIRDLDVHMGVNYSAACEGEICHTPAPGMPHQVWWLGADFGHAFDRAPGSDANFRELLRCRAGDDSIIEQRHEWETYRNVAYVRHEIEKLARQLAALMK
jgi:hypothetical protein